MKTILSTAFLSLSLLVSTAVADVYVVAVDKFTADGGIERVARCLTKAKTTGSEEVAEIGELSIRVNDRVAIEAHQVGYHGYLNLSVGEKSKEALNIAVDDSIDLIVANSVAIYMYRIKDKDAGSAPELKLYKVCKR